MSKITNSHTVRKYKGDPFRPNPRAHADPKSRRHFPITQDANLCTRSMKSPHRGRCANRRRCAKCFNFSLWQEEGSA